MKRCDRNTGRTGIRAMSEPIKARRKGEFSEQLSDY
jgi:hypothetical protein